MHELERRAARVLEANRRRVGGPAAAPLAEAQDDRPQLAACLGEVIFEARRPLAVLPLLDDPCSLEMPETVRQDVARRDGVLHDRVEPVDAEGQLADGEQ